MRGTRTTHIVSERDRTSGHKDGGVSSRGDSASILVPRSPFLVSQLILSFNKLTFVIWIHFCPMTPPTHPYLSLPMIVSRFFESGSSNANDV